MPWSSCQHPHLTQDTWTLVHPFHCEALELGVHWLLYQTWAAGAALVPDLMFKCPPCFDQATFWQPVSPAWLVASLVQELSKILAEGNLMLESNASKTFLPGSCVSLFSAACLVPHWFSLKTAFTKKATHSLVKQLLSVMCSQRTVFASGVSAGLDWLCWPFPSSK